MTGLARGLGDPLRLIEERQQRLDVSGERLALATRGLVERRGQALAAARLVSPQRVIDAKQQLFDSEVRALKSAAERFKADTLQKRERMLERLERYGDQLRRHGGDLLQHGERQVDQLGKLLESYSFHSVLIAVLPWCATRTAIRCWQPPRHTPATRSASSSPMARSAPG